MNVLLAVTGSIAAYKACDVVSGLKAHGHEIRVVLTRGGARFITETALATLSGHRVLTGRGDDRDGRIAHIDWARWAEFLLVAPASARAIARLAAGAPEDTLGLIALATAPGVPRLVCPAMNTVMYENPATRRNLEVLRADLGWQVVEPGQGRLACGDLGVGALAAPRRIVEAVCEFTNDPPGTRAGAGRLR